MFSYKDKMIGWFDEAVRLHPTADSTLKLALKSHERVPLLISNLAIEFEKVQMLRFKQGKKYLTEHTLKTFFYDYVDVFLRGMVNQKDLAYESEIKKIIREREQQAIKDMEATDSGNPQGIYSEIEMIVQDKEETHGREEKAQGPTSS